MEGAIQTMITTFQTQHGFQKIGAYHLQPDGTVKRSSSVTVTMRKPLVYGIFCDGICKYLGKTIQGYSRPLNYHRNDVMKTVRDGIQTSLENEMSVEVYAKETNLVLHHEGLELNAVEAIEQALITRHKPEWNNFVQAPAENPQDEQ
jgi:hypothetical protein